MEHAGQKSKHKDPLVFPCDWNAVEWSKNLKNKPLKKRITGKDLVFLFHDNPNQKRSR